MTSVSDHDALLLPDSSGGFSSSPDSVRPACLLLLIRCVMRRVTTVGCCLLSTQDTDRDQEQRTRLMRHLVSWLQVHALRDRWKRPHSSTTTVRRMWGSWAAAAARPWTVPAAGSPAAAAVARVALNPEPPPAPGTAPPAPGLALAPMQRTAPAAGCLRASRAAVQPVQPEVVAAARTTADCRLAGDRTAAVGRSRRAAARMPAATGILLRLVAAASRQRPSDRMTPLLQVHLSAPTAAPLHMHKSPPVSLLSAQHYGTMAASTQSAQPCIMRHASGVAKVIHSHSTCRRCRGGVAIAPAVVGLLLLVVSAACVCLRLPGVQRRRLQSRPRHEAQAGTYIMGAHT
jgi:hypothetical protein